MRINAITLAISAMAVAALGFVADAQQKSAPKSTTATAITVYKTPT